MAVPNTFTNGTPAVADDVNENFDDLDSRLDALGLAGLADVQGSFTDGQAVVWDETLAMFVPGVSGDNFTPDALTGLFAWYDASRITGLTDTAQVSQWNDLSPNGRHLTQGTAGNRPLYRTNIQNGKPVVRFDGVDDYLSTAAITLNQPFTAFAVVRASLGATANETVFEGAGSVQMSAQSSSGGRYMIMGGTPFSQVVQAPKDNAFRVITGVFNGATSTIRNNGVQNTGSLGTVGMTRIGVGRQNGGTEPLNGDIAELIFFNRALTLGEIEQVEAYLS